MTITRARGSALSRCATSSRHALSTLLIRDRLRGKPPATQDTASAFRTGSTSRTDQPEASVLPCLSVTRTGDAAVAGGLAPRRSSGAEVCVGSQEGAEGQAGIDPEVAGLAVVIHRDGFLTDTRGQERTESRPRRAQVVEEIQTKRRELHLLVRQTEDLELGVRGRLLS